MINGKNYQTACHRSYCYYGNGERRQRNNYTLTHGRMKAKFI